MRREGIDGARWSWSGISWDGGRVRLVTENGNGRGLAGNLLGIDDIDMAAVEQGLDGGVIDEVLIPGLWIWMKFELILGMIDGGPLLTSASGDQGIDAAFAGGGGDLDGGCGGARSAGEFVSALDGLMLGGEEMGFDDSPGSLMKFDVGQVFGAARDAAGQEMWVA
jgi:hypothetical protein